MHDPREPHLTTLKRIRHYLCSTLNHRLHFQRFSTVDLMAYSDTDWASCPSTRMSTSGYAVFLGDNLFPWSSKHHNTISRSSAEAKYRAMAETCWFHQLLREPHIPPSRTTLVYCDNVNSIYLSTNPVQHQE